MAGFSIILLMLLFCWPAVLAIAVFYLAIEAAAVVVTSPAFPALLVSMVAATLGSIDVAVTIWRIVREHHESGAEGWPSVDWHRFIRPVVLFVISSVAFAVAVYLAGVAVLGYFSSM